MPTAAKRYRPHGQHSANTADHTYNSHQRGYTKAWHRAAKNYIAEQIAVDPRCRICNCIPMSSPRRRPYEVDHRVPPSSAGPPGSAAYVRLFWDRLNWRLSCISCNAAKGGRTE